MHAKFYKIGHRLLEICVTLEHNRISYTDTFDFLRPKKQVMFSLQTTLVQAN